MNDDLISKFKLPASLIDINAKLGIVDALTCLQDNMCEYFKLLGCDGLTMLPICNAFFVITKTIVKFVGSANWLDEIEVKTNIAKKSNIRVNLSNSIYLNKKPIVLGLQEMCAVDGNDRKLRMVDSTLFPQDINVGCDNGLAFSKIMVDFDERDFVKEIVIDASHLDFYKHTNNVEYARFVLSTLTVDEISNSDIDTFEIHYISQCVEGDKVKIYKKVIDNIVYHQMVLNNGQVINKSKLIYKN